MSNQPERKTSNRVKSYDFAPGVRGKYVAQYSTGVKYSIYVREKIERGVAAADAKQFASDAEVEAEFNRWLPSNLLDA